MESGDLYSCHWYDQFQLMAGELAGRLDLYPIEFFFCCQPGAGFAFGGADKIKELDLP